MRKEQAHTLFPGLNLAGAPGCLQHWPPGASPQGSSRCLQPVSHTRHPGTGSPSRAPSPLSLTRQPLLPCPPDALLAPCFTPISSPGTSSSPSRAQMSGGSNARHPVPSSRPGPLAGLWRSSPGIAFPAWLLRLSLETVLSPPRSTPRLLHPLGFLGGGLGGAAQLSTPGPGAPAPCWLSTAALSSFTECLGTTITSSRVSWRVNEVMLTHPVPRTVFQSSIQTLLRLLFFFLTQRGALF